MRRRRRMVVDLRIISVDESEADSLIVVNHSVEGFGSDKEMAK
jgi:hypothetical protein